MRQAEEILNPIRTAITRARGPLFKFMTLGSLQNTTGSSANRVKLASTKKGIQNFFTGSLLEVRPLSIDKLQGMQTKVATLDEWLSGELREDPVGAIEQGAAKVDDYVIVCMSSEGTVRNGSGDDIKMELSTILRGETPARNTSIWWYKLDSLDELRNPDMWIKANPNLGLTVSYETYQEDLERAETAPAARNDILAKRFGWPMEGYTFYFTYEETFIHNRMSFWGMPCALGADLSQGNDFCAFTFLFPLRGGAFGVKTRCYISELTQMRLAPSMRIKYDRFVDEGSLVIMPGTVIDTMDVYDDLDKFICENEYDVRCFGFDPYNAKEFTERWERENGPFGIEKVIQGVKTESVPLGELKMLSEERMLLFDQELMSFAMGILDGSADEKTMLNYYNRTIEPILSAITTELKRKFLTKTARTQRQSIEFFRDPFKLVPVNEIAEIADKFTRNEIMSSNEMRQIIGMIPSKDPNADELRNKNLSQSSEDIQRKAKLSEKSGDGSGQEKTDKEEQIQNEV